jgi:uncharacterized membrane protein SpoIIM required for sporulation
VVDVDAYVHVNGPDWDRLAALLARRRQWGPEDADEVLHLYRRASTDLSVIRSTSPDPELVGWLSALVARARAAITGTASPAWRDALRFLTVGFPVALAASWRWWATVMAVSLAVALGFGVWVATSPDVLAQLRTPEEIRQYVEQDFASYYSASPAQSFAAQVFTNNVRVAALCLLTGVFLLPPVAVLCTNVVNLGISGGVMAANARLDLFFGLITPHGLLELTAVFVAAGAGLRLGWTWIAPGPRPRLTALARQGRITGGMALGVGLMLLVSAAIEAFVTPSGLPTAARIGIGAVAELTFLAYVAHGARLLRAGADADVPADGRAATAPVAG